MSEQFGLDTLVKRIVEDLASSLCGLRIAISALRTDSLTQR
jgi:hypothetical protein